MEAEVSGARRDGCAVSLCFLARSRISHGDPRPCLIEEMSAGPFTGRRSAKSPFMRSAGMVQSLASRSISSQVMPNISDQRRALRTVNFSSQAVFEVRPLNSAKDAGPCYLGITLCWCLHTCTSGSTLPSFMDVTGFSLPRNPADRATFRTAFMLRALQRGSSLN